MRRKIGRAMPNHHDGRAVTGNLFLDSLPSQSQAKLIPALTLGPLKKGQVLAEPGVQIDEIFFPVRSVISTVTRMLDGGAIEVGLAGREGMSALSIAYGSRISPHLTVVQIADSAYFMGAGPFLDQLHDDARLMKRVMAFAEYSFVAATQFAACNRLHPIEERYARWILMADDRVGNDEFLLTQEYSAQMLGVRRAGVTVVAGAMGKAGLITYRRGHVSLLDREGLERASCECYRLVNSELYRLMGYGFGEAPVAPHK
jgi:CRP-like cAMP-binding protein